MAVVSKIIVSFWYSIRETLIHISRKKEIALFILLFLQFVKTFNTIKTIWDLQNKFFLRKAKNTTYNYENQTNFFFGYKRKEMSKDKWNRR